MPAFTSRSAFSSVPCAVSVQIVAFFTTITAGWGGSGMRQASLLPITIGVAIGVGLSFAFSASAVRTPTTSWEPTFSTRSVPSSASYEALRSKISGASLPRCTVNRRRLPSIETERPLSVSGPTTSVAVVSRSVLTVSGAWCSAWPHDRIHLPEAWVSSLAAS